MTAAELWMLAGAVLGIAILGGFTAGMTLVYVLRLRRPARARPHVAHVREYGQQRAPGAQTTLPQRPTEIPPTPPPSGGRGTPRPPEPATFTPGRVEPSPFVRWRQP